jgi:hypothetical protein
VRVRGHTFRDEDDAYDYFVQREIDDSMLSPVEFQEEGHRYLLDGAQVSSVTEIIAPLRKDTGASTETLEWKRQVGKAVHKAIELFERNDLETSSLDPMIAPYFEGWVRFKRESGFRAFLTEQVVWSKKYRYAGTLDVLGTRTDGPAPDELIDAKCVWSMGAETAVQTAGYALALQESHGIKVRKRGGVQLLRDGTFRFFPYNDANDERVFLACLSVNSWKRLHQ